VHAFSLAICHLIWVTTRASRHPNARLDEIGTELEAAARENVLAPLVAAENAAAVWESLDLSRKRAIIKTLMTITLHSPGRGARRPFDPASIQITWRQQDSCHAQLATTT
jgi:hypothetical protein